MRWLGWLTLVFIFSLLWSCDQTPKYVDFIDDLEHLVVKDGKLVSEISELLIGGESIRVDTLGFSGMTSIYLDSIAPFGLNYRIPRTRTDEYLIFSVKYKGAGNLVLVAQDQDPDFYYRKSVSVESALDDWKTLKLKISIPPIMKGHDLKLYVWNEDGKGVFVDDFALSYQPSRRFPEYDPSIALHI